MKHRGVVCEKCGVEVIQSKVRRERMGHIELASPVAHIWFLKSCPPRWATCWTLPSRTWKRFFISRAYIVLDPGDTPLHQGQILSEERYRQAREEHGDPSRPASAPRPSSSF
jgi:DNA-directed RNA polymerase subunit beta'